MGYVLVVIVAIVMLIYAAEEAENDGRTLMACFAIMMLLGVAVKVLGFIWSIVLVIWRPVLVVAGVVIIWCLINFLIECYVNNKSDIYPKLKKLYDEARKLPSPTNIDLEKSIITVTGKELPEELFFVGCHEKIQEQLDLISSNRRRYEEIKAQKDAILRGLESNSTRVQFEKYVAGRYDRRISGAIASRPDTIQAKIRVLQYGETKEISYSFDEIVNYNSRYDELKASLEGKRQHQREIEEKERLRAEQERKEAARKKAAQETAEARRKEAIRQERSKMSASLRYDVLKRDNFRCTICGRRASDGVTLHVDHIKPVSKGGKTEMSNLRTLCDYCNLGKSDKYDPNGMN